MAIRFAVEAMPSTADPAPVAPLPPSTVSVPTPTLWNLPAPTQTFTGREDLLTRVETALGAGDRVALTALAGMGGIGKTQIALEFARRHRADYDLGWFLRAEEPGVLRSDLSALAVRLGLAEPTAGPEATMAALRQWWATHDRWLLVYDNVEQADDTFRAALPTDGRGHVLLTSRSQAWGGTAEKIAVGTLPRDEAVALLLKRAEVTTATDAQRSAADRVADALGDLPLALEQAAAYVDETGISFDAYLDLFQQRRADLLAEGTLSSAYPATVAMTWSLAFEKAEAECPAAGGLLRLCACLAPDDIPGDLIRQWDQPWPGPLDAVRTDPSMWTKALAALRRHSLIRTDAEGLSVHRLVQAVTLDRMTEAEHEMWMTAAQQLLDRAVTGQETRQYLPGYATDSLIGVRALDADRLGIKEDVAVLTSVMLAEAVKPPLAIGLFGNWGTGKSFFMQAMREETEALTMQARQTADSPFCGHVASIEFNAWHYVETHLMASLVSHILERLAAYVSPRPELGEEADLRQARVETLAVVTEATSERQAAEREIVERQRRLQELREERETKAIRLKELRPSDLATLLSADEKAKVQATLKELGVPATVEGMEDLQTAWAEAEVMRTRAMGLVRGLVSGTTPWVTLGLVGLALVLGPVVSYVFEWFEASGELAEIAGDISRVVTLLGAAAVSVRKATDWLREKVEAIEEAKERAETALETKRATKTEQEETLEAEVAALEVQEREAAARVSQAAAKVEALDEQIRAVREGRSLAVFLAERLHSDDYRQHLGLTATIRRDFEALGERLKAVTEAVEGSPRPVERVVLYIDDLDRCPAEKVVEVLQAVHLLLAYPLFVVVVGVDPRWLMHSLRKRYLSFENNEEAQAWATTPQNYLEKIFQIPFALRPMNEAGYGDLVAGLLAPLEEESPEDEAEDVMSEESGTTSGTTADSRASAETTRRDDPTMSGGEGDDEEGTGTTHTRSHASLRPTPGFVVDREALVIRPWEADYARQLHSLISTPRAVKRFANVYRLLKAPVKDLEVFEGSAKTRGEFRVPMLLLAVSIGSPDVAAVLLPALYTASYRHDSFLLALDSLNFREHDLSPATRAELSRIVQIMRPLAGGPASKEVPEMLRGWIRRVARYSFDLGKATGLEVE